LRPRLEAAGADLKRIFTLGAVIANDKRRTFNLQTDLDALGDRVRAVGDVRAVIIDPITSYMGKIDSHKTTDVRFVLEPLSAFAAQFSIAILAVTHPPKAAQAKALHSATGSLAYVAASRLVFFVIAEPSSGTGRRLLLPVKSNLGLPAPGLGFHIAQRSISKGLVASHIVWDSGPVTMTADQALAAASSGIAGQALSEALDFLRDELAAGPRASEEIKTSAARARIAWRTVCRAKEKLGIKSHKAGLKEGWHWNLPNEGGPEGDHP
jgi:AAA domain